MGRLRGAWLLLGVAMVPASALILWQGRGLGISSDEVYYYGRVVADAGDLVSYPSLSLEYLLAPHNGHLQLGGKLVYEGVFAVFGPDYTVLRLIELAGILGCVALFFALARRRVGEVPALAAAVLLLFLGAAWEVLIWPFDLHTVYALGFGLIALLLLEREGGTGTDAAACILLVASVITIELGLAMALAAGVLVFTRPDWARRAWIVLAPVAVYAAWAIWARRFDQSDFTWPGIGGALESVFESASAVVASLTGLYAHAPEAPPSVLEPSAWASVLAAAVLVALIATFAITRPRPSAWAALVALATYWGFIALASRPEDLSRYMFAGALLLLLVAAEAVRARVPPPATTLMLVAALAASLPTGLAKLADGRDLHHADRQASGAEYAMLELAADRVAGDYTPPLTAGLYPGTALPGTRLDAGQYLAAAARAGSLAYSLDELRARPEAYREVADVTLVEALRLDRVVEAAAEPDPQSCEVVGPTAAGESKPLAPGETLVTSAGHEIAALRLARFAPAGKGRKIAAAVPGAWRAIAPPHDAAAEPWRLRAGGPVRVCGG